jgi:hypothetical protein
MEALSAPDIVLTGIPRGGTTLACHLLGQAADTLALFEPMPVHLLPVAHDAALEEVVRFFSHVRKQALSQGRVPSKHRDGHVPDNPYGERGDAVGVRPWLADLGEIDVGKPLSPAFRLVIKHNSAFVALLPKLATRYPVIGVVRNPLAVLASWRSVDLSVSHGCLPAGERLDPLLAAQLAAQPDLLRRQVLLLDWFFERLLRWVAPARLIRYEDTVASGGSGLLLAAGRPAVTGAATTLRSRNLNPQYAADEVASLLAALREHASACWRCYSVAEVTALAAQMSAGQVAGA